jgi:hypothetical protein
MSIFRRKPAPVAADLDTPMDRFAPLADRLGLAHADVMIACEDRGWSLAGIGELVDLCAAATGRWAIPGDDRDFERLMVSLHAHMIKYTRCKEME